MVWDNNRASQLCSGTAWLDAEAGDWISLSEFAPGDTTEILDGLSEFSVFALSFASTVSTLIPLLASIPLNDVEEMEILLLLLIYITDKSIIVLV